MICFSVLPTNKHIFSSIKKDFVVIAYNIFTYGKNACDAIIEYKEDIK